MRSRFWSIVASVLALVAAVAAAGAQPAPAALQSAVLNPDATAHAQPTPSLWQPAAPDSGDAFWRFFRDGEWYGSWGYSKQYYLPTDIHVSQPSLGNAFTIHGVHGGDDFSLSDIFNGDLFGPEYNIRIGRFINDERTIGLELSLDHSKYTTTGGQFANVSGVVGGLPANAS